MWQQKGAVALAGANKSKAPAKGHQAFDSKAVTASSVASAFAKAEADGSVASGRSGASRASGRTARAKAS